MKDKHSRALYREARTRRRLEERSFGRPRLSVFRSLKYVYAQVIDDAKGKTVAAASSLEIEGASSGGCRKNIEWAKKVGVLIGQRALAAGVKKVVFDRGSYLYHGKLKALADSARASGLEF